MPGHDCQLFESTAAKRINRERGVQRDPVAGGRGRAWLRMVLKSMSDTI